MSELNIPEVFDKLVDNPDYRLTAEEASGVWLEVYNLFAAYPDRQGSMLKLLFTQIEREAYKGERCGVCGSYEDTGCMDGC